MLTARTALNRIASLSLIGLVFSIPSVALAQRVVLNDPDYSVLRKNEECSTTVPLLVHTNRPQLFAEGSEALASLMVASRAILAFECPDMRGIRLRGFNPDTGEKLYAGGATVDTRWKLVARFRSDSVNSPIDMQNQSRFSVAQLEVGMDLDSVVEKLRNEYGHQGVRYEDYSRTILAGNADCPLITGKSPRGEFPVGARCIRAHFTTSGKPMLDRLRLAQSVPGDQVTDGIKALQERYGRPTHNATRDPNQRERLAGYGSKLRFGWGGEVKRTSDRGSRRQTHQLEADLSTTGSSTLLLIRLFSPSRETIEEKSETFGF